MHSNGTAAISYELASVDLNDGPENPGAFAAFDSKPPPAPELHNKGVVAIDITEQFKDATQKLDVGQLIKDPYFTLFEAVGALEIMDRKMDSGYLEPGETMEDDYDFSQPLLPEEIIGIIDQLLCHEMAWHMGYPLSQTIFTSLYIDRILMPAPLNIDNTYFDRCENRTTEEPLTLQILRAYCLGLIKTCSFVNNRVKAEHYYEEEDFVTHTYNRSLLEEIEHISILEFLSKTSEQLSDNEEIPPKLKDALLDRLAFRAKILETVELADSRTSSELKPLWMEMASFSPKLRSSTHIGKSCPAAFSVKLQRKLASTVPPRPIVEVSQDTAYDHLERLCRDGSEVVEVFHYYDSHSLMTFISLFQARKPQPSVYIRTLLQHYLFGDMIVLGTMSIRQVLDEDLSSVVLPASVLLDRNNDEIEVPSDPRFNMATRMEIFRSRAAGSYLDILRTMCQNRCRIRRTLCHTISDWDNLQLDAEELDQELRMFTKEDPIIDPTLSIDPIFSFPLSSWAYFYKLCQMEWIVQMGFELETYQPGELASMYWYLQYLSKTRKSHLDRIRGFTIRSHANSRSEDVVQEQKEYTRAISFVNFSTLEAAATSGFADALSCLYSVLSRLELIPEPPMQCNSDEMRYEVRMKPFLAIGLPELIPLGQLTELVTQRNETIMDILDFAATSIAGAKKGFEVLSKLSAEESFSQGSHDHWVANIKACLKACIFTGITVSTLRKAVQTGKGNNVSIKVEIPLPGKGYHDWWVVPKVIPIS